MFRRLGMSACLLAGCVLLGSAAKARAQLPPPPQIPFLPICIGAGCTGPQGGAGPTGPAGPQGPAGPAGGFDTGKLYTNGCPGTGICQCDAGDFALGGGGTCATSTGRTDFLRMSKCYEASPEACHGWLIQCITACRD